MRTDAAITATAIDWYVRQRDLNAADWQDFTDWLEADPAHAAAFDTVAMRDALVDPDTMVSVRVPPVAANDDAPVRGARRWWGIGLGGVIAAALAIVALPNLLPGAPALYGIDTGLGARRTVALADGTRIELSGDTHLTLDRKNPRFARLDRGQAVFHVHHDAGAAFTVHAGPWAVQDVGTVFDVAHVGPRIDVAVAEGAVLFQPGQGDITLRPGFRLSLRAGDDSAVVTKVAVDSVGEWRFGRLSFTNEPLDSAAASLSRMVGADVVLAGGLESRRFTGVMKVMGDAARDVPRFAMLTGTVATRHGEHWVISPARGGSL